MDPIPTPRVVRRRCALSLSQESKVEQCHRGATDINKIMARFHRSGLLPQKRESGFYGDFTSVSDYQSALASCALAQRNFMSLPSSVRKEFNNDPVLLFAFLQDENNLDRAVELGLISRPVVPDTETPVPPDDVVVPTPPE